MRVFGLSLILVCFTPVVLGAIPGVERIPDIPALLRRKTKLLSVLVTTDQPDLISSIVMKQAFSVGIPVFVSPSMVSEQQQFSLYKQAFSNYRFSLIIPSDSKKIEPALIHSIWQHTVPVYNGLFQLSTMFTNGVVGWLEDPEKFNMTALVARLESLNEKIRFLWSYQQIMQEVIWYRYGSSLALRTAYIQQVLAEASAKSTLAVVGIYSAAKNRDLRNAIRMTWGFELSKMKIEVLFFLPSEFDSDGRETTEDIVKLSVQDGYKYNSKKGVLFLQWMASNRARNVKFLIKTDDDIFWNVKPLIEQLKMVQPVGYLWGFIDYISPVPRNTTSPFFNSVELYPFPTFPTYPRGLVRVLSMDIVEAIASKAARRELRMIFGDDPCFGVHLRQARLDNSIPFLRIDDFASYTRFAMQPTCNSSAWRHVNDNTWIVHHVSAEQIVCLNKNLLSLNCDCFNYSRFRRSFYTVKKALTNYCKSTLQYLRPPYRRPSTDSSLRRQVRVSWFLGLALISWLIFSSFSRPSF